MKKITKLQTVKILQVLLAVFLISVIVIAVYSGSKKDTPPPHDATINTTVTNKPIPNQVVISFKDGTSEKEKLDYIKSIGGVINTKIANLNSIVVNVPSNTEITNSDIVSNKEPDYYANALEVPNDSRYQEQWALPVMDVPSVWNLMTPEQKQAEVKVAVIDSGVCKDHPDLSGKIIDGWNFINNTENFEDDYGHGCSVAGIIGAITNNNIGISGISPNVKIMPLKVLDNQGMGSYSNVAAAIVYAVDHNVKIINLSLGGPNPSSILESAVNYAKEHNVLIVAAAGNTGTAGVLYPARYDYVIAVGSVDSNLQRSSFSTYGEGLDIYAPGRDILTTKLNNTYGLVSGTSFAAPQVVGEEALGLITGKPLSLDGKILGMNGNKEVVASTTIIDPDNSTTQNSNVVTAQQEIDLNSTPVHIFWPFDTTDWSLTGNGHDMNTHKGADDMAEDWNRTNGANDCDRNFNAPFSGTVIASYRSTTGYGNTIVIQSYENPTIAVRVAHLNLRSVSDGNSVAYGQKIGETGSDGTDNCHAHISLYKNLDQDYNGHPAIEALAQHREFPTGASDPTQFAGEFKLDGQIYGSVGGFIFLSNASGAVATNGYVFMSNGNEPLSISVPIGSNGRFSFTNNIYPGTQNFIAVSNGVYGYGTIFVSANTSNLLNITLGAGSCSQAASLGDVAANSCTSPVPTNLCPNNENGKYCGVTLGINDSNLYQCTDGNNVLIQQCSNGCNTQPQGTADFCNAGSTTSNTCPNSQNGLYCGSSLGLDANTLYNCQNGVNSNPQTCSLGCIQKPPGTADVCRTSTSSGSCPSGGNGNYCGSTLGLDPNTLFNCNSGSISIVEQCNNGCELKPPGTADACYATGSGSGGDTGSKVTLYGDSNYGANSIRLQVGAGDTDAPDKGAWYKSMSIPSGWSVILSDKSIGLVGNSQCFSSSVSNLETVGSWANSIESMRVFSSNVCPTNTDGVRICRVTGSYSDHPSDCMTVTQDIPDLAGSGFGNDTLKSIDIGGDWEAVLFEDWQYGGRHYTTNGTITDLGGIPFGYGTSSIQVRKRNPAAFTLYRLGDYNDGHPFGSDRTLPNLEVWNSGSETWNDTAQSMRVASGYEVIGCSDADFHGICGRVNHDVSDLNALAQGLRSNLSSIQVCSGSCPPTSVPPAIITPNDGDSFLPTVPVSFSWAGNGDKYLIEYWGGSYGSTVQSSGWRDGMTAWTKTDFATSTQPYYWHVKSWTPVGDSGWSPTYSFKVQETAPIVVYIDKPESIVLSTDQVYSALVSPSDAANLTYTWSPTPISGQNTPNATYNFTSPGNQTISVAVSNSGGSANTEVTASVGCATGKYLAEYYNGTSLNGSSLGYSCEDSIDYTWGNSGPMQVPSNSFEIGDGRDGVLDVNQGQTIYTDNVRSKISSPAASGQNILCTTTTGFTVGDQILIIQSQGANTGNYEFGTIDAIEGCGFTMHNNLANAYTTSAQAIRVPQYTTVSIAGTLSVHPWDGNTGGVMAFRATNSVYLNGGSIDVTGTGYRGPGRTYGAAAIGVQGEGVNGTGGGNRQPNEPGGGGAGPGTNDGGAGAGGGAYRTAGGNAKDPFYGDPGIGSISTYGTADLSTLYFGGAGGSGGTDDSGWDGNSFGGKGGNGGGIIFIETNNLYGNGNIISNGQAGEDHNNNPDSEHGGGGGGAGGSIKIISDKVNTDNINIGVNGGAGGKAKDGYAGNGGFGQSFMQFCANQGATTVPGAFLQQTNCDKDNFSIRWTGSINFATAGIYNFTTWTDDGVRAWVDGDQVIDSWTGQNGSTPNVGAKTLTAGNHEVKLEYFDSTGTAMSKLTIEQSAANNSPVVSQIPDQTVTSGTNFNSIDLNNYGTDVDAGDAITWSYSGNTNVTITINNNIATLTYPANWTGSENITFTATDTQGASASSTISLTVNQATVEGIELLSQPWHLTGDNGASELYEGMNTTDLIGKDTLRITYDLHGIDALGGDASAIIFDQNGWQFVSLSDYGENGYDGTQTVDIPLSDFTGLDINQGSETVHTRFWYGGPFTVDIYSILAISSTSNSPTNTAPVVTQIPGQSISSGESFNTINLSSYGSDSDTGDSLAWSYSGNNNISISLNNDVATLTYPTGWTGSEDITFKATDTQNAFATSTATFQVNSTTCSDFTATYFNNTDLSGTPAITTCEANIDHNWGSGAPTGLNVDAFSARWVANINFATTETYTFTTWTDDGTRLWVDGTLLVDRWVPQDGQTAHAGSKTLTAGTHEVKMEYYEGGGGAKAQLDITLATNTAPTVNQIPGQTITEGQTFSSIDLNSYGSDPDSGDTITWSYSGNTDINVAISNNIATLTYNSGWTGSENITFTATDTQSASASSTASFSVNPSGACSSNQFTASYYNNLDLSGTPALTTCENDISHDWGLGSPDPLVNDDDFSARWEGNFTFTAGTYKFVTTSDDGVRLWVDGVLEIDNWTDHGNTFDTADVALSAGNHVIKMEYYDSGYDATAALSWLLPQTQTSDCSTVGKFCAKYFNNTDLSGTPTLYLQEPDIDHDWGQDAPGGGIGSDNYSTRWEGQFNFDAGTYTFGTASDDGIRVWIDGVLEIDNWSAHGYEEDYASVNLTSGLHTIKVEYYELGGNALAAFWW